jgi:hypothetical protein
MQSSRLFLVTLDALTLGGTYGVGRSPAAR